MDDRAPNEHHEFNGFVDRIERQQRMDELAPSFVNTEQLLARYPRLGIPHFQRGLVWNEEATALLLESLYYGTPCGNIILWRAKEPGRHGEACLPGEQFYDLLVDGQQRTRMLFKSFADATQYGKVWCLDLMCEPAFVGLLVGNPRPNLFVCLALNPHERPSRYQYNTIPLMDIIMEESEAWLSHCQIRRKEDVSSDQIQAALLGLRAKVKAMPLHPVFGIITLQERDGRYGIGEVVSLYNRINSAGRKVEAEEMAYATLVRLYPETTDCLRTFFAEVHGLERGASRDELLKRQRERSFGFKLYLRTFVQVCNYHFARSSGTQDLSFDVIDSDELRNWFAKPDSKPGELFIRTTAVLKCVHRILRDQLNCDDLRMLPDTECLIPALQMLIRFYPAMLDGAHDKRIAFLIMRHALEPSRTQVGTLDLLKTIDNSDRASICCAALIKKKGIVWSEDRSMELKKALANANTLNDRYVLLLYWLVRRNKAMDFVYDQLPESQRRALPSQEMSISKSAIPEKQHICPSSSLGQWFYDTTGRVTTSRHPVNNIGNLTYISQALNGLEGLSNTWMNTDMEAAHDSNLDRHYLAGAALREYELLLKKSPEQDPKSTYESFTANRRMLIQQGMESWLVELNVGFADCDSSIEPEQRLANRQAADYIRTLDYPDMVEDALIALVRLGANVQTTEDTKQSGHVILKVGGKGRTARFRMEAFGVPRRIEIEDRDGLNVFNRFREVMIQGNIARQSEGQRRWVLSCEAENQVATTRTLADFVNILSGLAQKS